MKLFEVRAEVVVYVLAEDREGAWDVGRQSISDEVDWNGVEPGDLQEVTSRNWCLDGGWSRGTLVYGSDKETTVGEILDGLPAKGGAR